MNERIHFTDHPKQTGAFYIHYGACTLQDVHAKARIVGELFPYVDPKNGDRVMWRARLQLNNGWQVAGNLFAIKPPAARELLQIEQLMKSGGFIS